VFGPQDILRPPHARSRPFCYRSIPTHAQTTRNYLVYILSSLELRCAGVRQGVRAIHPSIWGPKRHLQMRRTHEVGSRWICILAPARLATFFGMGMCTGMYLNTPYYLRPLERAVHIGSSTNTWGPLKPSQMWNFDVVQARLKLNSFCPQLPGKQRSLGQRVSD
jgi:hypothetical protein